MFDTRLKWEALPGAELTNVWRKCDDYIISVARMVLRVQNQRGSYRIERADKVLGTIYSFRQEIRTQIIYKYKLNRQDR